MGKPKFSDDFKQDAVHQITVRGYPVREVTSPRMQDEVRVRGRASPSVFYSVRRMCYCLNIHPSGFYAWVKNPLSHRALEDEL